MHQYSHYRGIQRRREKGSQKIFEEKIAENFPSMVKETVIQMRKNAENPRQDKSKEEHTKTHSNQTGKN